MNKKILIKKYENRRLYDVTHSRYVNLDEIARAVQDEFDVQVLDASTGEDITRFVMTQIITEHAKAPDSVFPLDILRQMVVASGKASQENAFNYMRAVAEMYKQALRGISKTTMSPFEVMQSLIKPGAAGTASEAEEQPAEAALQLSAPPAQEPQQEAQEKAEIQELKRRIHELESMVANMNRPSTARKKKKEGITSAAKGRTQ